MFGLNTGLGRARYLYLSGVQERTARSVESVLGVYKLCRAFQFPTPNPLEKVTRQICY